MYRRVRGGQRNAQGGWDTERKGGGPRNAQRVRHRNARFTRRDIKEGTQKRGHQILRLL